MKKINTKELISYILVGILITIVSFSSYYILSTYIFNPNNKIELQITNILSWIITVLFAYITNRIFVFKSKDKNILKEGFKFCSARISTLLIDMLLMFIFVSLLHFNDKLIKVLVQIVVVSTNYFISKLFVFKK